jgi:glycosyltransferase involved in cell wall biosynthesis
MSDWFAPAYKAGGPIRSCVNFAFAMSDVYNVYILTANTDFGNEILDVETNRWIEHGANIEVQYITKEEETHQNLISIIEEVNPKYIYLNSMFSVYYSLAPLYLLFRNKLDTKIVLAPRGMLHEGAIKYKYPKKKLLLNLLKWFGVAKKIQFQATDEQEQKDITKHLNIKSDKIQVVANFPQSNQKPIVPVDKKIDQLKLVFISRVAPKKNILFFLECLKHIKTKSQIVFSIYGSVEEGYWDTCLEIVKKLPSNIKIEYKGSINHEEVEVVLQENHFFVLSTFGENFGHAIFESFAVGRPVIISDQTPWRDLKVKKIGWDIELNNQGKWITAIEDSINMEQEEFDIWCQSSWQYAHDFIYNSGLREKYLKLFSI